MQRALVQRALVWLNLYGREALRHKLKNGLKTQKMQKGHLNFQIPQPHSNQGDSGPTLQRLHQKFPHGYISDSSDMNNPDELLNPRRLYYSPIFSVVIFTSGDQSELRLRKWIERQVGVAQFRSSITYIPRYMTIFLKSSEQCLVFKGIIKSQESKIWTFFLP